MTACCGRRVEDGTVDREEINRAVRGNAATLSPTERRLVIWRLRVENGWGLTLISRHVGYSRTETARILAEQAKVGRP